MKLKAVATNARFFPQSLINAFNSIETADEFRRIVISRLHVRPEDFGPATHYVQETDLSISTSDGALGVEVTLSKVSVHPSRAVNDFKAALKAIERYYTKLINRYLHQEREVQLFCVLALDAPVKFPGEEPTTLIELPPKKVKGEATGPVV